MIVELALMYLTVTFIVENLDLIRVIFLVNIDFHTN